MYTMASQPVYKKKKKKQQIIALLTQIYRLKVFIRTKESKARPLFKTNFFFFSFLYFSIFNNK